MRKREELLNAAEVRMLTWMLEKMRADRLHDEMVRAMMQVASILGKAEGVLTEMDESCEMLK